MSHCHLRQVMSVVEFDEFTRGLPAVKRTWLRIQFRLRVLVKWVLACMMHVCMVHVRMLELAHICKLRCSNEAVGWLVLGTAVSKLLCGCIGCIA